MKDGVSNNSNPFLFLASLNNFMCVYYVMRILLENEAYAKFEEQAKAKGKTTRELGVSVITDWLSKTK